MAYVNVLEWRSEQVAEWLQGLDDAIGPYVQFFINNNVTGQGLLNMTTEDLNKLHVEKIGHQELILEALEHLRNLHHNLDTENFQYICLRLSCKARSLCNEIRMCHPEIAESGYPSSTVNGNGNVGSTSNKQAIVSTETMSAVADVLDCLWTLISWLDRPPFNNNTNNQQHYYVEFKKKFCDIGLQLATSAQRDTFAENPVRKVLDCCKGLDDLSDTLIREVNDSLILQPASLDVAHVKKRSNSYNCGADDANFGIAFEPFPLAGVHVINSVRFQSPAHQCDRIHPGDEIVQINYQTVIGWSLKKVCQLMEENPSEMTITLKKRPRHLPYVIPYMKPIRIPARSGYHNQSKKNSSGRKGANEGFFNNLPSPRAELLVAPNITLKVSKPKEKLNEEVISKETSNLDQNVQGTPSDSDSIGEDDDSDESFLPSVRNNSTNSGMIDSDGIGQGANITGIGAIGLSPSKSPTQSVRSLLSRPRTTPQRRATISGSSPSLCRPYINISEIWSYQARHIHSEDHHNDEGKGSNTSTLRSNDSGHATMGNHSPNPSNANSDGIYSSSDNGSAELRKKSSTSSTSSQYKNIKYLPRPMTVGGIPSSLPSPEYINVATDSTSFHTNEYDSSRKKANYSENINQSQVSKEFIATGLDKDRTPSFEHKHNPEYHNLGFEKGKIASETQLHSNSSAELKSNKAPMPKPRTQVPSSAIANVETTSCSLRDSGKSIISPNRKKPIPEPRSAMNSPQITSPQQGNKFTQDEYLKNEGFGSSKSHNLSSSSITKTIKSYLPEVPKSGHIIQPVPTSEFQSFRRSSKPASSQPSANLVESKGVLDSSMVGSTRQSNKSQPLLQRHNAVTSSISLASNTSTDLSSANEITQEGMKVFTPSKGKSTSYLPEYVNTTPPAVPARNPSFFGRKNSTGKAHGEDLMSSPQNDTNRKLITSELLQNTKQPSSRRFSGDYVSINSGESIETSLAVTPMPYVGRRSSTESSTSNFPKEQTTVSRRSSNPLPPPPPILSPNESKVPSFPYYVSDVYQGEYTDKSISKNPHHHHHHHAESLNSSTLNYSELSSSGNPVSSNPNTVYNPMGTSASAAIKSIRSPPASKKPNNPELPPPFTPSTYSIHDVGKGKLTKKDSVKKS